MAYQIIDNVLDKSILEIIQKKMLHDEDFPWYYNDSVVYKGGDDGDHDYNFQFIHNFYNYTAKSNFYGLLKPIIEYIEPAALTRIKANLTPRTSEQICHSPHIDFEDYPGKTAVFYINSNNGMTVLDGEGYVEVESVENRMVVFDTSTLHSGWTQTDEKVRCVLNINFIPHTHQKWDAGDLRVS
jgi:hypothetical protein